MSYRRTNTTTTTTTTTTHATRPAPAPSSRQRSYIVSIDTGSFADVEIVVGDYRHRAGVWTSSPARADTVKVSSKSNVYAYVPTTSSTPSTKRTPFTPLQPQPQPPASAFARSQSSSSASDRWNGRTYERDRTRDYLAARQTRLAEERARAHLQRQRQQREEEEAAARRRRQRQLLAEAEAEAAAEAEARRVAADARRRQRQRLAEQQRHEEQKRQLQQRQREERRRRARRAHEIASAWCSYEARWSLLSQNQGQRQQQLGAASLTFERIPWPVTDSDSDAIIPPLDGRTMTTKKMRRRILDELLNPEAICEFLLSPAHSPDVSPKDRIRAALRRWHPDKFARVLSLVAESDKDTVADGVGIVVRCLNEMLERENHAT